MNREDVIRVAREAGLLNCDCCLPFWDEDDQENWKRFFVNFAALVAAAERQPLHDFIARLLDPEDLGHAVTAEVRQKASALLGRGRA